MKKTLLFIIVSIIAVGCGKNYSADEVNKATLNILMNSVDSREYGEMKKDCEIAIHGAAALNMPTSEILYETCGKYIRITNDMK